MVLFAFSVVRDDTTDKFFHALPEKAEIVMRCFLNSLSFHGSRIDDAHACELNWERGRKAEKPTSTNRGRAVWRALARVLSPTTFLALAIPSLALGQTNNEGLPLVPLQIVNNYNTTENLFVYIHGLLASSTPDIPAGSTVYVSNVNGDIKVMPVMGTYQSLALNLGTGQSTTIMFPKLNAARVYVSLGRGLQVCCNSAAGAPPSEPIGWSSTEPNYNTPFDWAELNWDNTGNAGLGHKTRLGGNVTQVDMFGLPLLLTLKGKSTVADQPATANAGLTRRFDTIMSAYQALGTPWTQLIVNSGGAPSRVISPYHGIGNGVFPNNALDSYISQVFSFYQSNSLTVRASCGQDGGVTHVLSGSTSGGALVFSEGGTARFQFLQPTTLTVYQNEIHANPTPASPLYNCLSGVVAAKLGGAFIRTSLLLNTNIDACNTSQFYVGSPIQQYAKFFHTYGVNHLAYSFGYDDTCGQSSYINIDDPTGFSITVGGKPTAAHDFNADGRSDIAWQGAGGAVAIWFMNGGQVSSSAGFGAAATSWSIVAQRDFNGDGYADLLWRDTTGNTAIWFMNGTTVSSSAGVGSIPTTWGVVATGDFDGDGFGDILWQDNSGNLAVWLMNGAVVSSSVGIGNVSPGTWSIAGTGDFDGDGKTDLLWHDTAGNTAIWFMNGTAVSSSAVVGNVPTVWSVAGTGDFNGDGKADVVWRDSTGNTSIWLMNGATVSSAASVGSVPTTWTIALVGDFNGDGTSDLLWRDTGGITAMWLMNGGTLSSTAGFGSIPIAWTVQSLNAE